jgi:hypothetical protein
VAVHTQFYRSSHPHWQWTSHQPASILGRVPYTVKLSGTGKRRLFPRTTGMSVFFPWVTSTASRCQQIQRWTFYSRYTIQGSSLTFVCTSEAANAVNPLGFLDRQSLRPVKQHAPGTESPSGIFEIFGLKVRWVLPNLWKNFRMLSSCSWKVWPTTIKSIRYTTKA